ncbi:MAG: hypothetical protein ACOZAJ_02665 [Patescibacteria group bacterium]
MKLKIYYFSLLLFIVLLSLFLYQGDPAAMTMPQMVSVSFLLALYVVLISLVGEGRQTDEREVYHRYLANRWALLSGTVILSVAILIQLFDHRIDYWLLGALLVVNVVKITSLIYLNHTK